MSLLVLVVISLRLFAACYLVDTPSDLLLISPTPTAQSSGLMISPGLLVPPPLLALFPSRLRFKSIDGNTGAVLACLLLMGGVESNPGPRRSPSHSSASSGLMVGTLNVRSAVNKSAEIHEMIESHGLDVLILSETWIAANAPAAIKHDIAPPGYSVRHAHRSAVKSTGRGVKKGLIKKGGGLAIIYRNTLTVSDIGSFFSSSETFEQQCIKITVGNRRLNVIAIYRPPPSADNLFFNDFANLLDMIELYPDETMVCGDFNCPGTDKLTIDKRLQQLIVDHNLQQHVSVSTRKREGNILDLVISRQSRSAAILHDTIIVSEVGFSDHNLVEFRINMSTPRSTVESFSFRNIKLLDTTQFMNIIRRSTVFNNPPTAIDDYVEQLKSDVVSALDQVAPLKHGTKRVAGRPTAAWISEDTKTRRRLTRRLERQFRKSDCEEAYVLYRKASRAATKSVKQDRLTFYRNKLSDSHRAHDPRMQWRLVKELLHSDDRPASVSAQESASLARSFTSFFQDKLTLLASNISAKIPHLQSQTSPLSVPSSDPPSTYCSFTPVTLAEVDRLLRTTPAKSSPLDFIPTSLLKSCSPVFIPILAKLANLSFTQGTFPSCFKSAQVTPLLKKPTLDPKLPSNYRPISNLNSIGKLLERLALARLRPHITTSSNYSSWQSGYRAGHSTETAMLNITDALFTSIGQRQTSLLCTIDLSAAFDTVTHSILLDRLKSDFGLDGTVGSWLRSYVTDRSQFVKVGRSSGEVTALRSGVPQGSVLGPILFAAYMAPISRIIENFDVRQQHYADDTTLYIELQNQSDLPPNRLILCIEQLVLWCNANNMHINPDKTEAMIVASPNQLKKIDSSQPLNIAGTQVVLADNIKIVGVTLDSSLSFDKHVSAICQSCNYHLRALRHVRPMLSFDLASQLACSIVASRLDYCNSILFGASQSNIARLQRIQNNLARIVCLAPARASASTLLERLHWLPIEKRIHYKIACITFNSLETGSPKYLRDVIAPYIPQRHLRSSNTKLLNVPSTSHMLAAANRSFRFAAPAVWNSLSLETRSAPHIDAFKRRLKTELFVCATNVLTP
jgi:Reverse transcriptase (RNA-dependent DNA polymerase)